MRLLVDEDSQARTLVQLLRAGGHDVLTAREAGLSSLADREVLARATAERRVVLTRNCGDFLSLHTQSPGHCGILAVYEDADPSKNMTWTQIARSLANVESAGVTVVGMFLVVNAWCW